MRNFTHLVASAGQRSGVRAPSLVDIAQPLGRHIAVWVRTCVDYYAAAAMYEQLRGLSDSELQRRGLSRANLGRDVCAACDNTHRWS